MTRLPEHDSFGLAVLIFQLLMEGSHPFRAHWLGAGEPPPIESRISLGLFPYSAVHSQIVVPPKNAPSLDTLHPWLAELFRRCFVDGYKAPRWRPGPELWAQALAEVEAALVCCAQGHFYSSHLKECPYCALSKKRAAAAGAKKSTGVPAPARAPASGSPFAALNPFASGKPAAAGAAASGSPFAAGTPFASGKSPAGR